MGEASVISIAWSFCSTCCCSSAMRRCSARRTSISCSRADLSALSCALACVDSSLVIPTGYSFNLDGTSIYLTMAAVFLAQATNTPLDLGHQLILLAVLLL